MILWLSLFIVVIFIAFILAYLSVLNLKTVKKSQEDIFGVFLVRNIQEQFYPQLISEKYPFSLERLFKSDKSTLVIYGARNLLKKFEKELKLLELEDYTEGVEEKSVTAWVVDSKYSKKVLDKEFINKFPVLPDQEQFWFQQVLMPPKDSSNAFLIQSRAVYIGTSEERIALLKSLTGSDVADFSSGDVFSDYKKRIFNP